MNINTTLAIRIGFEVPSYTYDEPQFDEIIDPFFLSPTGQPENGPIFLVKENNIVSEQTFLIAIQVTDSAPFSAAIQPATLGEDYRFGQGGQASQLFLPSQQRIAFLFELFTDTLAEGTEAFQATVFPEDTQDLGGGVVEQFPISSVPVFSSSEIFITIVDDDRKFEIHQCSCSNFFLLFIAIIIGFANTSYTVDEAAGTLQVDVQVFSPPDDQPLQPTIYLVIQTVSGSASKCIELVYLKSIVLTMCIISWRK